MTGSTFTGWNTGVYANPGTLGSITGNTFTDNVVGLSSDALPATGLTISGNTFTAGTGAQGATIEHIGVFTDVTANAGNVIGTNSFTGTGIAPVTIYSGAAGISVTGTGGNDAFAEAGGAQTLDGAAGNDTINGGDGNDSLIGGADDDVLSGDLGVDVLTGGAGNDTLTGGNDNDQLFGGDGDDNLSGGSGDNDQLTAARGTTPSTAVTASETPRPLATSPSR